VVVTEDFTFIHTHKCGGSFITKILTQEFNGKQAGNIFHTPRKDCIFDNDIYLGTVRNPFDWYVSMYHFYTKKENPIIKGLGDFKTTIKTLLNLYGTDKHKELQTCDLRDNAVGFYFSLKGQGQTPRGGFTNQDFIDYPKGEGFYTWLWERMNADKDGNTHNIHLMRVENLNQDFVNAMEKYSHITTKQRDIILQEPKYNTTDRGNYKDYYDSELVDMVYERDSMFFDRFGYEF
jgi:hypothetical protein